MIGKKISPILEELEDTLWDYEARGGGKPEYTIEGFRGAIKIFMSVMMDKMWELQCNEKMTIEDKSNMVIKLGNEVRDLVKIYTDIDTFELYK